MKYRLNPRQEAWVKALESGEYAQGKGSLRQLLEHLRGTASEARQESKFCCLGVACEVYVQLERPVNFVHLGEVLFHYGSAGEDSMHLPQPVMNYFDVIRNDAGIVRDTASERLVTHSEVWRYVSLASANDNEVPFIKIAEFIRAYPERIFRSESLIEINDAG